jgi:hypothetical protein
MRTRFFGPTTLAPVMAAAFAFAITAHGQTVTQDFAGPEAKHDAEVAFLNPPGPGEEGGQEARQKVIVNLVTADNKVVTGKPYAADASTETVQALADGNRIVNRTVSKFYRDSQGRTRREQTFGNVDPSNPGPHEMKVFIDDPVGNTASVVDPGEKTVRTMPRSFKFLSERDAAGGTGNVMFKSVDEHEAGGAPGIHTVIHLAGPGEALGMVQPDLPRLDEKHDVVKEDLGKRNIEGLECNGTQQTITIPAGEVGNERPISIVTETWYSPAIAAIVQSSTSDPRFGQTTYQLRNVQTSEQQRSLFEPPADYKVEAPKR